jgi:hypothetical protein
MVWLWPITPSFLRCPFDGNSGCCTEVKGSQAMDLVRTIYSDNTRFRWHIQVGFTTNETLALGLEPEFSLRIA